MLILQEDIENLIINKYLDVNDKIKLLLTCKYFNEKVNINHHIGTFIKNHLGLDEKNQHDLIILKKHKMEMIKEIADFLLNNIETEKKCKQSTYFPFSYTARVKRLTYEESINFITNRYKNFTRKKYQSYSYFSKNFPLANALLLCKNLV